MKHLLLSKRFFRLQNCCQKEEKNQEKQHLHVVSAPDLSVGHMHAPVPFRIKDQRDPEHEGNEGIFQDGIRHNAGNKPSFRKRYENQHDADKDRQRIEEDLRRLPDNESFFFCHPVMQKICLDKPKAYENGNNIAKVIIHELLSSSVLYYWKIKNFE